MSASSRVPTRECDSCTAALPCMPALQGCPACGRLPCKAALHVDACLARHEKTLGRHCVLCCPHRAAGPGTDSTVAHTGVAAQNSAAAWQRAAHGTCVTCMLQCWAAITLQEANARPCCNPSPLHMQTSSRGDNTQAMAFCQLGLRGGVLET
jgi:hypothetical protein